MLQQVGVPPRVMDNGAPRRKEGAMPESVYKVIELVGTSSESWEKAAAAAVQMAEAIAANLPD